MKYFDTDWNRVFEVLPVWDSLSPTARKHFLLAAPSHAQAVFAEGYGSELEFALRSGLIVRSSPIRVKPAPERIEFRRVMAQLAKFPLFDVKDTDALLLNYRKKHFTYEEDKAEWSSDLRRRVSPQDWLESFLHAPLPGDWEKPYRPILYEATNSRPGWLIERKRAQNQPPGDFQLDEVADAAKRLVRHALSSPSPISLSAAATLLPEALRPRLAVAFRACVRYCLLYPALRGETLEAVFWIHPKMGRLLHRPPARVPTPVTAQDLCGPAFLMEDAVQVLTEATTGESRLVKDSWSIRFYAKIEAKLKAEMTGLPDWLAARYSVENRLANACALIDCLKLGAAKNTSEGRRLEASAKGLAWLKRAAHDRLRELLLHLRKERLPHSFHSGFHFFFLPGPARFFDHHFEPADLCPAMEMIWLEAASSGPWCLDEFLEYHSRMSHPLTTQSPWRGDLFLDRAYNPVPLTPEDAEKPWRELLEKFYWERLVPLGAVDAGLDEQGRLCFRVNAVGQCLLGQITDFEYGQPVGEKTAMVQPNFEIVFLHPNLAAEIDLSPFTERCGKGVGTLFRLTRKAIFKAAAIGETAENVLAILRRHSAKDLPRNVVEEVSSWFASCRRIHLRHTILIEAGEPEVALRLRQALGPQCTVLSGTTLEYRSASVDAKTRKALSEQGLFIGHSAADTA